MITEYKRDELIDMVLLHRGYEPLEGGVALEASESLRRLVGLEVDLWYLNLLATGPAEWVEASDLRGLVVVGERADGALTFTLPRSVRRLTRLQLEGWNRPARIVGPSDREAEQCRNPMWRNGAQRPLAVVTDGEVEVYGGAPGARRIVVIEGIKEPSATPTIFRVDPRGVEILINNKK